MLAHCSRHRNVMQVRLAWWNPYRVFLHVEIGPHSHQLSMTGISNDPGAVA